VRSATATTPASPTVKAPAVLRQRRRARVCRCPLPRIFRCSTLPLTNGASGTCRKAKVQPGGFWDDDRDRSFRRDSEEVPWAAHRFALAHG
jgi:hypothetical protein